MITRYRFRVYHMVEEYADVEVEVEEESEGKEYSEAWSLAVEKAYGGDTIDWQAGEINQDTIGALLLGTEVRNADV